MADKFLDKEGLQIVADNTNLRVKIVTEIPSTPRNDMVILYNGADTTDFKKGGIYKYNGTEWESLGGNAEQVYDSTSPNAQSGKAVDMAVRKFITDNTNLVWETKTWQGLTNFAGQDVWTDGTDVYYSNGLNQYVLDRATSTWEAKTWEGDFKPFYGARVWNTENNIYYSYKSSSWDEQYVLNKSTGVWEEKTWNGLSSFSGNYVWTDGDNIYYSDGSENQYVLNESTSTWEPKTWYGLTKFGSFDIWFEGNNVYYSHNSDTFGSLQYKLNKATSTWEPKTWNGLSKFSGQFMITDGNTCYYAQSSNGYVLDITTDTWVPTEFNPDFKLSYVWHDGDNLYVSAYANQYVLHRKFNTLIK
jgi:hypothetical protein